MERIILKDEKETLEAIWFGITLIFALLGIPYILSSSSDNIIEFLFSIKYLKILGWIVFGILVSAIATNSLKLKDENTNFNSNDFIAILSMILIISSLYVRSPIWAMIGFFVGLLFTDTDVIDDYNYEDDD